MPSNAGYLVAAYVVAVVVYGAYLLSLVMRARDLTGRGS